MPLKVVGVGFGRTGTLSTCTALNQLGFPCYHMFEVMGNPANKTHLGFWAEVANAPDGTQHPWEEVFANYTAAVDNPACCVWRELMAAYPDAKVLLTLHPKGADAWYDSTVETIYRPETMWQAKVIELFVPARRVFGKMSRALIWGRSHKNTMNDRAKAIAHYHQHIEDVKAAVPPERLLIYSADQGWGPLCAFLGVATPATPFPNVNDRASIQKYMNGMMRRAYGMLAATAVVTAAVIYGLIRAFG